MFYRTCWDIILSDVYKAVQEFFIGFPLPKAAALIMIVLLPKGNTQTTFADYRLIALCTFLSKIQTRILATRLSTLLPLVISSEQAGFQQGKGIVEHVLLANSMIHWLDHSSRSCNCLIKLDLAKAFDRVNWHFLHLVLARFGF